jgi:hypothetical protein
MTVIQKVVGFAVGFQRRLTLHCAPFSVQPLP